MANSTPPPSEQPATGVGGASPGVTDSLARSEAEPSKPHNGHQFIPMEGHDRPSIAAHLAHRVGQGADAEQIADTVVATWHAIDGVLNPIIGERGVAALYKRSLHLSSPVHPWLEGVHEGVQATIDLAPLKSVLARQSSSDAAAGGGRLLQTFHELLVTVIGASLSERLLRPVWAVPSKTASAHNNSP